MSDIEEIENLRESFREILQQECTLDAVKRHYDGHDLSDSLWQTITGLGWTGLSISEDHGGLAMGYLALGALYRELGRAVAPVPMLPTLLVADALMQGGTQEQQARWLPGFATGATRATLSLPSSPDSQILRLSREGDRLQLHGIADQLLDLDQAILVLALARDAQGQVVRILLDLNEDVLSRTIVRTTDQTRSLGSISASALTIPADRLIEGGEGLEQSLARHAAFAIACDSIGGAEAIFEITLDYLKMREQFGRPIGSFQALKHRCADHRTQLTASGALLDEAAALLDAGEGADIEVSGAKAYCALTYAQVAHDAVQLHGGIGFTWEHVCHLFLKRAKMNELLFGSPEQHLDRLVDALADRSEVMA